MNLAILKPEVQKFINDNLQEEITKLILKGSLFKEVSIQELANQIIAKKKSEKKLPTWFKTPQIYYPKKISIEQTSSEITAKYKATLIKGSTIIDLTGGFGVDTFYFSKAFKKVIHCEINPELSKIVTYNFKQLKTKNVSIISSDGFDYLKQTNNNFDCIYIDPSRRSDTKGKVFLLKDCLPNIVPEINFLFTKTNTILIKVSPILDISNTINDLKNVKEVHVIAIKNEVKELLFLLEKNNTDAIKIKTINFLTAKKEEFTFKFNDIHNATLSKPLSYLYEPNAAILKSGGFHQITKQLPIFKLHKHSHLYTSDKLINFPGRTFKIESVIAYDKKKLQSLLPNKKANITTRNFPKTVSEIRKETKIKDGGNFYLFFTTDLDNQKIIVISKKR